jgi:hypothetical protein
MVTFMRRLFTIFVVNVVIILPLLVPVLPMM